MLKATIRSLLGHKLRLLTTSLAVLLGVAFMAGTLVLTDTIGKTFDQLFATINAGVDAHVRGEAFESDFGEQRDRLDAALVDVVADVDGVERVIGQVEGYAQVVDASGDAVGDPGLGAPTFGRNWVDDEVYPFTLVEGRPPATDDEVVLDRGVAKEAGLGVGDSTTVLVKEGAVPVTVVGIATFGDDLDSPGGSTNVLFTTAAAQRLMGEPDRFDALNVVAADGVGEGELRDRIAAAMPDGVEVVTGEQITEEQQDAIAEGLSFFGTFLLVFALIALFVGSFIIYNTFSILVAQRSREMALLRAIGASRRQVVGAVLLEAAVVGLIASVLGLLAGIGVAAGLKALLAGLGIDIPAGAVVVTGDTVVTAAVTGLVVSIASAVLPARRAARVAPIAALRDVALDTSSRSPRRAVAGVTVTLAGVALLFNGLLDGVGAALTSVGVGAALLFVGVAVLGPMIARPMARLIGAPLPRLRGMAGTLARENAMRNPKRTSATAAALMVGVGLVGGITILAASGKASIETTIDEAFVGDFVIDPSTFGFGGVSPELGRRIDALPEVESAVPLRYGGVEVDGESASMLAVDAGRLPSVVDIELVEGSLDDVPGGGMAVFDEAAATRGWSLGDLVPVRFTGGRQDLRIVAIYGNDTLAGRWFVDLSTWEANVPDQVDSQLFVTIADGSDVTDARRAINEAAAAYPNAEVLDLTEMKEERAARIDGIVNLVYVLLLLAVVIALLGIANTLALSIFERTRELGLLRAVGMTRAQVRSTVRWESVIIAVLGAVLGLAIGTFLGWAIVTALADEGINTLQIPAGRLAVITGLAALAGVVAAILPARRAARLNVLDAIGAE